MDKRSASRCTIEEEREDAREKKTHMNNTVIVLVMALRFVAWMEMHSRRGDARWVDLHGGVSAGRFWFDLVHVGRIVGRKGGRRLASSSRKPWPLSLDC